jgi:peptide/nickel transport system substrate-binding protein
MEGLPPGAMLRERRSACAVTVCLLLLAAACSSSGGGLRSGPSGLIRVAAIAAGPFTENFNPLLANAISTSGYADRLIYEPLMLDDIAHGTSRPWLVTSFMWADGGKSLTLNLRSDVKWSDGQPMTADDVAFTFSLIKSYPALNLYGLQVADATAPAPDKAVVNFTAPSYQLVWGRVTPVPKHVWSVVSDPVKHTNSQPVGTGPYVMKSFSPQVITLEKNPNYWQAGEPKTRTLQFLAYDSENSMITALEAGEVDWISLSPTTDPAAIARRAPSSIGYWVTKPSPAVVFVVPNDAAEPTSLTPVRVAISQALDRAAITRVALGGRGDPVESPTGLDVRARADNVAPAYRSLRYSRADPAAAKRTLTAAGYSLGKDGVFSSSAGAALRLTVTLPTSNQTGDWVRISQLMTSQLHAAGIDLTFKTESPTAWRDDTNLGNFQLTMRSVGGTTSVYDLYSRIFAQPPLAAGKQAATNWERYKNPQAATLLTQYAASTPGSPSETAGLAGLEQLMVEQVPLIPLYLPTAVGIWRIDRFGGWPSQSDPYAVSTAQDQGAELVLARLTPTGK